MEIILPKTGKTIYLKAGLSEVLAGENVMAIPNRYGVYMFSPDITYEQAIKSMKVIMQDLELGYENEKQEVIAVEGRQ